MGGYFYLMKCPLGMIWFHHKLPYGMNGSCGAFCVCAAFNFVANSNTQCYNINIIIMIMI